MFDISIKPRFAVGVACYCFRWNSQAFAEGDVIADCLGVFVNMSIHTMFVILSCKPILHCDNGGG